MKIKFFLSKIISSLLVIFIVVSSTFLLLRVLPGGPFDTEKRLPPRVKENIEKKYKVGSVYKAEIVKLQDYGAFAALEKNIEGLIHQSYLSHTSRTIKPNKIFSVGDKVDVKILSIEKDKRRISLDYKSTQPNPWDRLKDEIGSTVKFKINNITEKALFGELIDFGITSMCHWKELSFSENVEKLAISEKNAVL